MMVNAIKVALAGNPNSGKTTLFNALTGAHQHVGNYPGVTVERKHGYCCIDHSRLEIVDLPGTYSLTAVSEEELVSRNFLIEQQPNIVVDIVDSSNLERNLYLTIQLLELGSPVILVLNLFDVAEQNGLKINTKKLSELLGVPVLTTIGNRKKGIDELISSMAQVAHTPLPHSPRHFDYGTEIERAISELQAILTVSGSLEERKRWVAIKLLENDPAIISKLRKIYSDEHRLWITLQTCRDRLGKIYHATPEMLIAERRYGLIAGICKESVTSRPLSGRDFSDRLDDVIMHPLLGLPIFLGLMYIVFYLTFTLAEGPMHLIEAGFDRLGTFISGYWRSGSDIAIRDLLVDGILGGVGGVVVFLPNILLLFLGIALLEDTGYMSRAAFIMDRFMHKIGLHGKSFIPMLIGFGCSVPAIMSTRILENKRDRLTTIMVIPLMSCGARLTIFSLIIPAFFPKSLQAPMLWLVYVIGIILAAIVAKVLRISIFKGESAGLIMELPPYRLPTLKGLLIHMFQRGWMYIQKAGTLILALSIVLWAMTAYPKMPKDRLARISNPAQRQGAELQYSLAGRIGRVLEPALKPLGFDWRIGTALIGSVAAKEMFVAQMGIIFSCDDRNDQNKPVFRQKLQEAYTPLQAFCIMLFSLIATPCAATIAVTRKETRSWGWALAQFSGLTALGYFLTLIVYQIGSRIALW